MNWFTRLLKSKINITIVLPPPEGVQHTTTPRQIVEDAPLVKRSAKSNLRFVEERKTDCFGNVEREVYYTEEFVKGTWSCVIPSISATREKAMDLHMMLLENKTLGSTSTKKVMWEGLDSSEAKSWITLIK